jgi:hypothetical protein
MQGKRRMKESGSKRSMPKRKKKMGKKKGERGRDNRIGKT